LLKYYKDLTWGWGTVLSGERRR